MIHKNRFNRRKRNYSKARRKYNIAKHHSDGEEPKYYKHYGQYIKGKVHCSCPLCAAKTNRHKALKGGNGRYNKSYTISDRKKADCLSDKLVEAF